MKPAGRLLRYLPLVVGLVFISQIETACDSGGISPKESVQRYAGNEPQTAGVGETADSYSPVEARKVIVNHSITIEVGDISPVFDAAIKLAKDNGGYTVSTNRFREPDGSYRGNVAMRVPSARADTVMAALRELGKVVSEGSTGEDITEQYVDLEARLDNARASEKRLAELMARRTDKLSDVLTVERELTRVRGDIESMEAKKRNWDTLTSMVSITVDITEPPHAVPSVQKVWHPIKTALGEAAEGFAQSLHYAIVFLGALIPWLAVLGLLAYVVVKLARRGKKTNDLD